MEYVLITGGTSGIGYELARCFANNCYKIIIAASDMTRLEDTKEKLEKEFAAPILIYQQDLTRLGAAVKLYEKIKNDKLKISILINNAGFGLVGETAEIDFQQDENMMILNMISLVELSKLFISDMYKQGHGKILNVASTGAFQPGPYTSTYFASKAFVLSYSRAIRYEAKRKGIQVCTLCPGATKTNFFNYEGTATPKNAMPPEIVAKYSYHYLMKNKDIMIPGLINNIMKLFPVKLKSCWVARMKSVKRP
jgi:short-subunit dehydrogenase